MLSIIPTSAKGNHLLNTVHMSGPLAVVVEMLQRRMD